MQTETKPYYPGFRDMNLFGAFALTLVFFLVIWLVVVSSRLLGLRRRIIDLGATLESADEVLRAATAKALEGAAFITPSLREGALEPLLAALATADDEESRKSAAFLAEALASRHQLEKQRIHALQEFNRLLANQPTAFVARILKLSPL